MTAYVIFDVKIDDPVGFGDFMTGAKPLVESFGGTYLARGGAFEVFEGDWQPNRIVLFQFPSTDAFKALYESPQYRALKAIRDECSTARLVSFEGLA